MDELDLLLDDLEDQKEFKEDSSESDLELALQEFSSSSNTKDRLEALKLLVRLMK